jgi:hypothetical protein
MDGTRDLCKTVPLDKAAALERATSAPTSAVAAAEAEGCCKHFAAKCAAAARSDAAAERHSPHR